MPLVSFLFMCLLSWDRFSKAMNFRKQGVTSDCSVSWVRACCWALKSVCKCQHGSCWVLRVDENLVLNGHRALLGVKHQMRVLLTWKFCSRAQLRTVCALNFICITVGWLSELFYAWVDGFLLFKFTCFNNSSYHPWEGLTWLCFDSDQLLCQLLWLCFCCDLAELPVFWLLWKWAWINTCFLSK